MSMMSTEAEKVAAWILEGLLDDISSWDDRIDELPNNVDGPHFDLWHLSSDPAFCINCYSLKSSVEQPVVQVCQLKCLEQKASGYCGHYALHFSLVLLRICQSSEHEEICKLLFRLCESFPFWRRYWLNIQCLLSQVSEGSWWPWTEEHIYTGDMERSYLHHLLKTNLATLSCGKIFVIHFAYGLLQDSGDHLCAVQERIQLFVHSKAKDCLVFILGVTNHWVTLMAYKTSVRHIVVLYLDSNNEPVLLATIEDIKNLVEKRENKHITKKGVGYTPWKRNTLEQSLHDQRDVVSLLCDCLRGECDLRSELINSYWKRLVWSYRDHVTCPPESGDLYAVMLLNWLESHYSAHIISEHYIKMLIQVGTQFFNCQLLLEIQAWVSECNNDQLTNTGISQLNHFSCAMQQLHIIINNFM